MKGFLRAEDQVPEKEVFPKDAVKAKRKLTRIEQKAKHYQEAYRQIYRTEIRIARMARKAGNFWVPVEPKLAFVICITGFNVWAQVWKMLQLLHCQHIFNGTFVKFNKASVNVLRTVAPHTTWGTQTWSQ